MGEHLEHPLIAGEDVGGELRDSGGLRKFNQMLQQQGGDAEALIAIEHSEGDFCARSSIGADVSAYADKGFVRAAAESCGQTGAAVEVEFGQVFEIRSGERVFESAEAVIDRALAERIEVLKQQWFIVRADRADNNLASVDEAIGGEVMRGGTNSWF